MRTYREPDKDPGKPSGTVSPYLKTHYRVWEPSVIVFVEDLMSLKTVYQMGNSLCVGSVLRIVNLWLVE